MTTGMFVISINYVFSGGVLSYMDASTDTAERLFTYIVPAIIGQTPFCNCSLKVYEKMVCLAE